MWSSKVAHETTEVWGPDAHELDPERFVGSTSSYADKDLEKKRRAWRRLSPMFRAQFRVRRDTGTYQRAGPGI